MTAEEKLKELEEYLWPAQMGMPNEHRNPLVAVKAREKILRDKAEAAENKLKEICEKIQDYLWQLN